MTAATELLTLEEYLARDDHSRSSTLFPQLKLTVREIFARE